MKKHVKILSLAMGLGMLFSTAACTPATGDYDFPTGGDSDAAQTLDVYLLYKGYGDNWLKSALSRFAKEEWVREKYPELSINYKPDSIDAQAGEKLAAGASINKFDLMFGVNLQGYESKTHLVSDLTDSVYLTKVPGEEVLVKDKVPQRVLDRIKNQSAEPRADGNDSYSVVSYITGLYGMLYNADLLKQMDLEVPLTTDQLMETGASIKSKKYNSASGEGLDVVLMHHTKNNYWQTTFNNWWAQYEGVKGYEEYFRGYDAVAEIEGSVSVLDQKGRLESLKVIEEFLTKYRWENAHEGDYAKNQYAFLSGQGVFHYNGDYFASEMQSRIDELKSVNISYDIRYMKMPVISAIIDRTPTIKTDEQLRSVIKEIDANKAYADSQAKVDGVSATDYAIIVEARGLSAYSAANSQSAVIPTYAAGKAVAADFLRFMYTEESIKDFTTSSGGILFPTTYDILNDEEVMAKVSPIHKSKMELLQGSSNCDFKYLPAEAATLLGKGGLTALYYQGTFESNFALAEKDRDSAEDILRKEKDHWNESTWGQMLAEAGLAGN